MSQVEMAKQEEQWKAEGDARTLAMADAISKDPERMKKAQKAAAGMVKDEKEREEEQRVITDALQRLAESRTRKAKYKGRYPKTEEA
jgi:isochorismate synthase EntC